MRSCFIVLFQQFVLFLSTNSFLLRHPSSAVVKDTIRMSHIQPNHPFCNLPGDPSLILTTNVDLGSSKLDVMKGKYGKCFHRGIWWCWHHTVLSIHLKQQSLIVFVLVSFLGFNIPIHTQHVRKPLLSILENRSLMSVRTWNKEWYGRIGALTQHEQLWLLMINRM